MLNYFFRNGKTSTLNKFFDFLKMSIVQFYGNSFLNLHTSQTTKVIN